MTNHRTSQRYNVAIEVEIETARGVSRAVTRDASLTGAFIETQERLAAGEQVRLRLHLLLPAHPGPIEVAAIVRWCDDAGVGVQFDGLRAKDVWALGKYFDSR